MPGRVYDAAGVLPGVRAGVTWYREGESSQPFPLTCMFRSSLFFLTYLGEEEEEGGISANVAEWRRRREWTLQLT